MVIRKTKKKTTTWQKDRLTRAHDGQRTWRMTLTTTSITVHVIDTVLDSGSTLFVRLLPLTAQNRMERTQTLTDACVVD